MVMQLWSGFYSIWHSINMSVIQNALFLNVSPIKEIKYQLH